MRGFWSLTVYNAHHFFEPNELDRYSLGTKNPDLHLDADGGLTLHVGLHRPHESLVTNRLPAPDGPYSLYLRAY